MIPQNDSSLEVLWQEFNGSMECGNVKDCGERGRESGTSMIQISNSQSSVQGFCHQPVGNGCFYLAFCFLLLSRCLLSICKQIPFCYRDSYSGHESTAPMLTCLIKLLWEMSGAWLSCLIILQQNSYDIIFSSLILLTSFYLSPAHYAVSRWLLISLLPACLGM